VSVLKDLEKSTAGRVEYPLLKPFQCALMIDKPFLLIMNGTLWLDSLYVAVSRTTMQSNFFSLEEGILTLNSIFERSLFITSSTFVGDGRGSSRAFFSNDFTNEILIEGVTLFCLPRAFTSIAVRCRKITSSCRTLNIQHMGSVIWDRSYGISLLPPKNVSGMSLSGIRFIMFRAKAFLGCLMGRGGCGADTTFSTFTCDDSTFLLRTTGLLRRCRFRDFKLSEGIFDVSSGSSVRLENCTFTNITVPNNDFVSTTHDDADPVFLGILETYNHPEDDADPLFDVERHIANDSSFPEEGVSFFRMGSRS
jgi:hypothetical protein